MELAETLTAFARGRYALVRVLGAGGEKIVYLVHDGALDRECALALLKPGAVSADAVERFRAEARALAKLGSHPHIVTVFDIGDHEGALFVVSEHLAGGDLEKALADAGGRFPVERALDVTRQLLRALAFVHERGIVHRDLKPANVWLMPDGTVKLGDFGIAQMPHGKDASPAAGTPLYMSPEQLRGDPLDGRSDLYALGCTLYELVTGAPPFDGSLHEVIASHLNDAAQPIESRAPEAALLGQVLRTLLAKSPSDRPGSATDVLRMLDDLQQRPPPSVAAGSWEAPLKEMLGKRDMRGAIELLRAHLAKTPDPEARLRLAGLLQFGSADEARTLTEMALGEFIDTGRPKRAAMAAAKLGVIYNSYLGNRVAARPWIARAWRLVKDEGPCVERGWVAIADVGCNIDDPAELREGCNIALEMARRFGSVDLEAKALADGGLALAEIGDVAEGNARIDEALALITSGAVRDPVVCAQCMCAFYSACARTSDLTRCDSWSRVLRERGLVGGGVPVIDSHCDSVYGGLLCRMGRWSEAESALERAIASARSIPSCYTATLRPRALLAELRVEQGRFDEAAELLRGHDDHQEVFIPRARLHVARGELDMAAAVARRGIRMLGGDKTHAVLLACVLVEAELRRGDIAAAQRACVLLDERVAGTKIHALVAEAACVRARVRVELGDREAAIAEIETALAACAPLDIAPLAAKLHIALARLHGSSDPGAALLEANAAASICKRHGVAIPEEDRAFLEALGVET
jgi:tetratricopeptide (TPR) repeat protein